MKIFRFRHDFEVFFFSENIELAHAQFVLKLDQK